MGRCSTLQVAVSNCLTTTRGRNRISWSKSWNMWFPLKLFLASYADMPGNIFPPLTTSACERGILIWFSVKIRLMWLQETKQNDISSVINQSVRHIQLFHFRSAKNPATTAITKTSVNFWNSLTYVFASGQITRLKFAVYAYCRVPFAADLMAFLSGRKNKILTNYELV